MKGGERGGQEADLLPVEGLLALEGWRLDRGVEAARACVSGGGEGSGLPCLRSGGGVVKEPPPRTQGASPSQTRGGA